MTILSTVLETVSDAFMLITIILTVPSVQPVQSMQTIMCAETADQACQKRILVSLLLSCTVSIAFSMKFFDMILIFRWLLIIINFSKYVLLTAFVYKGFSVRSVLVSFIVQFVCSLTASGLMVLFQAELMNKKHFINVVLLLLVRSVIMTAVLLISKKSDVSGARSINAVIPTYIYILILLSVFLLSGLIQTANFETSNIAVKIKLIKILASVLAVCFSAVALSLMFNVIYRQYESNVNEILKKQVESQLCHYAMLEKINTDIRGFRHDYTNHMKCLRSMLADQKYDDLSKYLDNLVSAFPVSSFLYDTGNYIADAVLTEKQIGSPSDVSIEFSGIIPADIDNTDLCTILSNGLDNAVEACICGALDGNKRINVYCGFKHGYFVLKIKNPTVNENTNGRFATTKADKVNHGFGLENIKRTVKKYNGYVSTVCENNVFTLNITFTNISGNMQS